MKLSAIENEHILEAARQMDLEGDNSWAEYWLQFPDGREYQFKQLTLRAYRLATGENVTPYFFSSNDSYRTYISKKFGLKLLFKVPDNVSFFTLADIKFFLRYAGKEYKSGDPDHEKAGQRIKKSIFNKTNILARLINVDGYSIQMDNRWQISGRFKKYSWARFYKESKSASLVYFTVGISHDNEALVYKIDCQRSQFNKEKALTREQVRSFDRIVSGTEAEWQEIEAEELVKNYDWESLKGKLEDFIRSYDYLFDEAVEAVENNVVDQPHRSGLERHPIPKTGLKQLPQRKFSFNGVIRDYDSENKYAKSIGDGGENLVIQSEKEFLYSKGRNDLADKVVKVLDGEGYDIRSFSENGKTKFIEVKTTVGPNSRPFIMTETEWEFMLQNSEAYHLVRIYDFDQETDYGKFFELKGNLTEAVLTRPKQVVVFIKDGEYPQKQ